MTETPNQFPDQGEPLAPGTLPVPLDLTGQEMTEIPAPMPPLDLQGQTFTEPPVGLEDAPPAPPAPPEDVFTCVVCGVTYPRAMKCESRANWCGRCCQHGACLTNFTTRAEALGIPV